MRPNMLTPVASPARISSSNNCNRVLVYARQRRWFRGRARRDKYSVTSLKIHPWGETELGLEEILHRNVDRDHYKVFVHIIARTYMACAVQNF